VNDADLLVASHDGDVQARHAERYGDSTRPLGELVHMEDPAFYVNPWPVYSRLQREAPVYYQRSLNTWVITRYDDVRTVARTPEVFLSSLLADSLDGRRLTEANLIGFVQALIAAGSDTVRSLLANLVALLAAQVDLSIGATFVKLGIAAALSGDMTDPTRHQRREIA
jgi:cytochrome P450